MDEMEIEPYPTGGTKGDIANWMAQWGPSNIDEMMEYVARQKKLVAEKRAAAEMAAGESEYNQRMMTFASGDRYEGESKDGKMHGQGIYYFASGDRYEGEWRGGMKDGQGVLTVAGKIHWFRWKEGLPHGYGIFQAPNGLVYEGDFEGFKRNGQGIEYYSDGSTKEGIWELDKFIRETNVSNNFSVLYLESLGEELVKSKKNTPVAFARLKREFNSQIVRALEETIICPRRHEEIRLLQERVEQLVGAEKRKRPSRYVPSEVRGQVLEECDHKCVECGSTENLEVDHIIPYMTKEGSNGSNGINNLQILCLPCNRKKGNKIGLT